MRDITIRIAAVDRVVSRVHDEIMRAIVKHEPMHSAHEGYAVIQEEVDELWDEVKRDEGYSPEAMKEAIQIAAMGIRYVADLEV